MYIVPVYFANLVRLYRLVYYAMYDVHHSTTAFQGALTSVRNWSRKEGNRPPLPLATAMASLASDDGAAGAAHAPAEEEVMAVVVNGGEAANTNTNTNTNSAHTDSVTASDTSDASDAAAATAPRAEASLRLATLENTDTMRGGDPRSASCIEKVVSATTEQQLLQVLKRCALYPSAPLDLLVKICRERKQSHPDIWSRDVAKAFGAALNSTRRTAAQARRFVEALHPEHNRWRCAVLQDGGGVEFLDKTVFGAEVFKQLPKRAVALCVVPLLEAAEARNVLRLSQALRANISDREVVRVACSLVISMTWGKQMSGQELRVAFSNSGISDVILQDAWPQWDDDGVIMEHLARVLINLACCSVGVDRISQGHGVERLVETLSHGGLGEGFCYAATKALLNLALDVDENQTVMRQMGIEDILDTNQALYPDNERLHLHANRLREICSHAAIVK